MKNIKTKDIITNFNKDEVKQKAKIKGGPVTSRGTTTTVQSSTT